MAHNITTVSGRKRLDFRREPYWRQVRKRHYVGYRAGADTWHAQLYLNGKRQFQALRVEVTGDKAFDAATDAANAWFANIAGGAKAHYLIDNVVADYVEHRRIERGDDSANEAAQMMKKHVLPKFKGREATGITTAELKAWRDGLLPKKADADTMRRAKDTANKYRSYLFAALELAYETGHIPSNTTWRRVKPFGDAKNPIDKARDFYPTAQQVAKLIEKCDDAFRPLVRAGQLTGFRLQALTGALVKDFDSDEGTLNVRKDKGHQRAATLSTAAIELFKQQAKDKLPSAHLFLRADGYPWGKSHQHRPFRAACAAATLPREFIFYSLRHYFISRALLAGVNVHALAKNVGTSPRMIEKHYGKFIKSDVRAMLDRVEIA